MLYFHLHPRLWRLNTEGYSTGEDAHEKPEVMDFSDPIAIASDRNISSDQDVKSSELDLVLADDEKVAPQVAEPPSSILVDDEINIELQGGQETGGCKRANGDQEDETEYKRQKQDKHLLKTTMLSKFVPGVLPQEIQICMIQDAELYDFTGVNYYGHPSAPLWDLKYEEKDLSLRSQPQTATSTSVTQHDNEVPIWLQMKRFLGGGKSWNAWLLSEAAPQQNEMTTEPRGVSQLEHQLRRTDIACKLVLRISDSDVRGQVKSFTHEAAIYQKLNQVFPESAVEYYGLWYAKLGRSFRAFSIQEYAGEEITTTPRHYGSPSYWKLGRRSNSTLPPSVNQADREPIATLMGRLWSIGITHRGVKTEHFRVSDTSAGSQRLRLMDFGDSRCSIERAEDHRREVRALQEWLEIDDKRWQEIMEEIGGAGWVPIYAKRQEGQWMEKAAEAALACAQQYHDELANAEIVGQA